MKFLKKKNNVFTFIFLGCAFFQLHCSDQTGQQQWDALKNQVVGTAKSVYNGGKNFIEGLGQSIGIVSSEYKYSFIVWNDSPGPVLVAMQDLTSIMGMKFHGDIDKGNSYVVGPSANSGDTFKNKQLYVAIWVCTNEGKDTIAEYSQATKEGAAIGAGVGAVVGMGIASPLTAPLGAVTGALIGDAVEGSVLEKYKIRMWPIYPWRKNDKFTYHYRVYAYKGKVNAEALDLKETTSEFSGQFYNSFAQDDLAGKDITMTFTRDDKKYTVTLEQNSFSMLESSKKENSIRPPSGQNRYFSFRKNGREFNSLIIPSKGIANVRYTGAKGNKDDLENPSKYVASSSMLYTYEISKGNPRTKVQQASVVAYNDNMAKPMVSMQGLKIGHYDQPTKAKDSKTNKLRIRDINPIDGYLWVMSVKQANDAIAQEQKDKKQVPNYASVPFDIPETVWIAYKTNDCMVMEKVAVGKVLPFHLIRPQISEKSAWLYVVSLQTTDDVKARLFLDRLASGKIGVKSRETNITKPLDTKNILQNMQANMNGIIQDTTGSGNSGVIGYVLLADQFFPVGVGSAKPFYYYIQSPQLVVSQLSGTFFFAKDLYKKDSSGSLGLDTTTQKDFAGKVAQWIHDYKAKKDTVKQEILSYIQQKGRKDLYFDQSTETGSSATTLSGRGKNRFDTFVEGPISIKNPPIMRKAGTNYYAYALGGKPASDKFPYWPEEKKKKDS